VLYMVLSAMVGLAMFLIYQMSTTLIRSSRKKEAISKRNLLKDAEFRDLQVELYGEGVLLKDSLAGTNHSTIPGSANKDSGEELA
jgi:hypothetical protein